jgi:SAM-dependent methyltransferase
VTWSFRHPDVRCLPSEALSANAVGADFDLIINCYGLVDKSVLAKYGLLQWHDDYPASTMKRLYALLRPGGTMLFTIPIAGSGRATADRSIVSPVELNQLLSPFDVWSECFWERTEVARWVWRPVSREEALNTSNRQPVADAYPRTLGCFVLRRPLQETP